MENTDYLKEDVKDFVTERLNKSYEKLMNDNEYKEKSKQCNELIHKINQDFNTNLFQKFRDENNNLQYIELQHAYIKSIYLMFDTIKSKYYH